MTRTGARTRRSAAGAVISIVVAASLAGCLDANVPTPGPTPTRAPDPTPTVTVYDLGATVWYEGLILHIDRATASLDERGGPVVLSVRLENPTGDVGELNGPIRLVVGGTSIDFNHDSSVPLVPANGSLPVQLTYDLQGISSIDVGAIEIGNAPYHVARVPLTSRGGEPAFLEPVELTLKGTGAAADLKITLRAAELRSDLPDWSQELSSSLQALTLTYDATYTGTFGGGFAFTGDNIALRLPDGTIVGPRRDGHSQSVELIGPRKTKKGLFSRFEIPSGATGQFALLVRNGTTQKAIVFTIGG